MITKIRLQNWKSFKDSTIYIDSLGILIGTNASGKSNVLDAFAFLRAVGEGKSLLDAIQTVRGGEDWIIRRGEDFAQIMIDSADEKSPWAAFTEQSSLWNPENLKKLVEKWKATVIGGQALGDASIVEVVKYYTDLGYQVEIFTGDEGLKAYEPTVEIPRRRRK